MHEQLQIGHTNTGDYMKKNEKMLNSVLSALHSEQILLRRLSDIAVRIDMKNVLQSYLWELDTIEYQAYSIVSAHGWDPHGAAPPIVWLSAIVSRIRARLGGNDSTIAEMILRSCTNGMIAVQKAQRIPADSAGDIKSICQKYMDCQQAAIGQMKHFL